MCKLYRKKKIFQIEWAQLQDFYIINVSYKKNKATSMPIAVKPCIQEGLYQQLQYLDNQLSTMASSC